MIYVYHTYCMSFLTRKHFGFQIFQDIHQIYMTPKMLSRQAAYWILSFEIFKWVYINNPLLSTYFREVCCIRILSTISCPSGWTLVTCDHILSQVTVSMGKPVLFTKNGTPPVFLIFLTGRPAGVVCGSGWGGFSRRTRGVTVGTGALGPTVSADLGLLSRCWWRLVRSLFRSIPRGVSPCFPQISYDCPAFMHKDMLLLEHAY